MITDNVIGRIIFSLLDGIQLKLSFAYCDQIWLGHKWSEHQMYFIFVGRKSERIFLAFSFNFFITHVPSKKSFDNPREFYTTKWVLTRFFGWGKKISNGHSEQEKNHWSNQNIVVSFVSFSLANKINTIAMPSNTLADVYNIF